MTSRRLLALGLGALLSSAAGCAIQTDSGPRDVPDEHPARVAVAPAGDGGEATGEGRIFLVASDGNAAQLRTVLRDSKLPQQLVETLVLGPNAEEFADGLTSELPASLEVHSVRFDGGVLVIDVSDDINELTGQRLRQALAQIVFTASEIPGTRSVLIRVDGEAQSWPNGAGELQTEPLTVYDFTGYAESSQPAYPVTPAQHSSTADASTTTAVAATSTSVPTTTAPADG
jgi:hypothetical protein